MTGGILFVEYAPTNPRNEVIVPGSRNSACMVMRVEVVVADVMPRCTNDPITERSMLTIRIPNIHIYTYHYSYNIVCSVIAIRICM